MRRLFPAFALVVIVAAAFQACSSSSSGGGTGDGGSDAGGDGGTGDGGSDAGGDGGTGGDGGATCGQTCATGTPCCTGTCTDIGGGLKGCISSTCKPIGTACASGSDCCSTVCTGNLCAALQGSTCKTTGETCALGSECCSRNCFANRCSPAYTCQAYGDICRSNADCCGGLCGIVAGSVGLCTQTTGATSCGQDGVPCNQANDCCTQVCTDPGSGVKACAVASGCRVTGDVCASDQQCCGGGTNPNGTVQCVPTSARCDNGQSCNGVGTICGKAYGPLPDGGYGIVYQTATNNNCCNGKDTCHLDSAGIPRCYGGCSNQTCTGDPCPYGYTGQAGCCIAQDGLCQFKEQCCNGLPCLPDSNGVGHCTASSCIALGALCGASADGGACCEGVCQPAIEGPSVCQIPTPPPDGGTPDGGATDGGTCQQNGTACTGGTQCCSTYCIGGTCTAASCQSQGGACTSTSDCCVGTICTGGSCQPGSTCPQVGQACSQTQDCCPGLGCVNQGTYNPCDGTMACSCVPPG